MMTISSLPGSKKPHVHKTTNAKRMYLINVAILFFDLMKKQRRYLMICIWFVLEQHLSLYTLVKQRMNSSRLSSVNLCFFQSAVVFTWCTYNKIITSQYVSFKFQSLITSSFVNEKRKSIKHFILLVMKNEIKKNNRK